MLLQDKENINTNNFEDDDNDDAEAVVDLSSRVHICFRLGSSKGRLKYVAWVPSRGWIK